MRGLCHKKCLQYVPGIYCLIGFQLVAGNWSGFWSQEERLVWFIWEKGKYVPYRNFSFLMERDSVLLQHRGATVSR